MARLLTLCIVCEGGRVLLGMKKRGFGEGRWNGFGGKVEPGETVEVAAIREMQEEVGLTPRDLTKMGEITFSFENGSPELEVHIFKVTDYKGEPVETEEMRPEWFSYADIPFTDMWPDDEFWLPYLLDGRQFKGVFHFDAPASSTHTATILREEIVAL